MGLLGNQLQSAYSATAKDTFNGDGSTVAFTLSQPSRTNDVEVFVENVQQEPTVAYSVSGTTLTFTEAPLNGTGNIYVIHRTQATQSLTVNTDDITDGAITAAKIASGVIPDAVTKSATAPSNPVNGDLWYDTDDYKLYFYNGADWTLIKEAFAATGGTTVESGNYKYHTFTSSGNFEVTKGTASVEYLIVAGGGAGKDTTSTTSTGGGAGGAGGVVAGATTVSAGTTYTITVGAGGNASNGEDSSAFSVTAIGGGQGGSRTSNAPTSGGSGGGGAYDNTTGASGTSGQGFAGGNCPGFGGGGGGGATSAGSNGGSGASAADVGGAGGAGIGTYSVWATATSTGDNGYYASGGSGSSGDGTTTRGAVSDGGGAQGGCSNAEADNGQANTGGGGGGAGPSAVTSGQGGHGGSGIVIIRYAI